MTTRLHLPEYEEEFLNKVYEEMRDFSGLHIQFVEDILQIAEADDDVYQILNKWLQSESPKERLRLEGEMANFHLNYKL